MFRNVSAEMYGRTSEEIAVRAISAVAVGPIYPGGTYGGTVTFEHKGPAKTGLWVGFGIFIDVGIGTPPPPFSYAQAQVSVLADAAWMQYTVQVQGTVPTDVALDRIISCQSFIGPVKCAPGNKPSNPYELPPLEKNIYETRGLEYAFQYLTVTYW